MAAITREILLSKRPTSTTVVEVEGLGSVRIRELTIGESRELSAFGDKGTEATLYILRKCMVGDDGKPLLEVAGDEEATDALGISAVKKIVEAARDSFRVEVAGDTHRPKTVSQEDRFKYRLCLALSIASPEDLDSILSVRQLQGWIAYYAVEPWGFEFQNQIMARQVCATFQPHSKRKLQEKNYLLRYEAKPRPTPEEYRAKSMRNYAALGGTIGAK